LKRFKYPALVLFSLVLLGAMALGANASTNGKQASSANPVASAGRQVSAAAATAHVINMQNVPKETGAQAAANTQRRGLPLMTGVSASVYAQRKANAAHSKIAATVKPGAAAPKANGASPDTPPLLTSFAGMSDSAATCPYFGGCEPPDQALAVSFSQVVQAVNTSIAVYNLTGALQTGFPKTAQSFFGIPNPGSCDPAGPFLSDPRAFYDQNFNRFWVEILQVEGAAGLNPNCPPSSTYWVAVSQTGNATGAWNIYHFDMDLGSGNFADFSEFGFDQQSTYFSGNMFDYATENFQYAEYASVNKFNMMSGLTVTPRFFVDPTLDSVPLDTIQPTLGEALQVGGPISGQFIASENIDFGGGGCSTSVCSGVVIITMSTPNAATPTTSAVFVSTDGYSFPPSADEPGDCTPNPTCVIDSGDTRINGTPTWHNGLITFSLNTDVNNGTQDVPAIFWGQIQVYLNNDGSIESASVVQQGYLALAGDQAAMYGALGSDGDGDLFMVYSTSSTSVNPSLVFTSRRVTFAPGSFHDTGNFLGTGAASYLGFRWGDYNAVSPSGVPFTDDIWVAGEFANSLGDWSTEIGHVKFVKNVD
jgi:hypothetical protein